MPVRVTRPLEAAAIAVLVSGIIGGASQAAPSKAQAELERYRHAEQIAKAHLKTFDTLDFDVFSNQKWDRLKESHSADIAAHWPDGHVTHG
ncbi:MAG: hypothetical protein JWP50_918, partial [Phenylobacterium sp.]|nr:hypothetical protein [Phenylobacterium sp.]